MVVLPTGQGVHVSTDAAPTASEYVSMSQFVHACEPIVDLYFPATHAMQEDPVYPASQMQASTDRLAAGEFVFAGHG
jgi:hypothetical protein